MESLSFIWKKSEEPASPLEKWGAVFGIIGAAIMSQFPQYAYISWPLWLVSSALLLAFTVKKEYRFLFFLQLSFTLININGFLHQSLKVIFPHI